MHNTQEHILSDMAAQLRYISSNQIQLTNQIKQLVETQTQIAKALENITMSYIAKG